jgi:hypothetical protein
MTGSGRVLKYKAAARYHFFPSLSLPPLFSHHSQLVAELRLVERGVEAAVGEQLPMRPLLYNASFFHNENFIGAARIVERRCAMTTLVRPCKSGSSAA